MRNLTKIICFAMAAALLGALPAKASGGNPLRLAKIFKNARIVKPGPNIHKGVRPATLGAANLTKGIRVVEKPEAELAAITTMPYVYGKNAAALEKNEITLHPEKSHPGREIVTLEDKALLYLEENKVYKIYGEKTFKSFFDIVETSAKRGGRPVVLRVKTDYWKYWNKGEFFIVQEGALNETLKRAVVLEMPDFSGVRAVQVDKVAVKAFLDAESYAAIFPSMTENKSAVILNIPKTDVFRQKHVTEESAKGILSKFLQNTPFNRREIKALEDVVSTYASLGYNLHPSDMHLGRLPGGKAYLFITAKSSGDADRAENLKQFEHFIKTLQYYGLAEKF